MTTNAEILSQIAALISEIPEGERKVLLRDVIAQNWPGLPVYSTLQTAQVQEIQTATVGTGVVPIYKTEQGWQAVMMKAGTHYKSPRYAADPSIPTYMIAGGFINLSAISGTSLVEAAPDKPESPRIGAVRELEEEFVDAEGNPVLSIDPDRLLPMDTKTLSFPTGEKRVVIGFAVMLNVLEVAIVEGHMKKLESETYRHAVRKHTENPDSKKPEICTASILPLADVVGGKHKLLFPDQVSLFKRVLEFAQQRAA